MLRSIPAAGGLLAVAVLLISLPEASGQADKKPAAEIKLQELIKAVDDATKKLQEAVGKGDREGIAAATKKVEETRKRLEEARKGTVLPVIQPDAQAQDAKLRELFKQLKTAIDNADQAEIQKLLPDFLKHLQDAAAKGGPQELDKLLKQAEAELGVAIPPNAINALRRLTTMRNRLPGAAGRLVPTPEENRLGARLEAPSEALTIQLGLTKGQGLVVGQVTADLAAAKAGLQTHDILLELAGKPVASDAAQFAKALAEIKPNDPVTAVVLRKGQKTTVKGITLSVAAPAAPPGPFGALLPFGNPFGVLPGSVPGPGGKGQSSVMIRGGERFHATHVDGELHVLVMGDLVMGKIEPDEIDTILIRDRDGMDKFKIDDVPAKYQPIVKHLLEQVEKKLEPKKP